MHEMSLIQGLFDILLPELERRGLSRVRKVHLRVGELAAVEPSALDFCYRAVSKDTPFEDSVLEIENVPFTGRCRACGRDFPIRDWNYSCVHCGSSEMDPVAGDELSVSYMEAD
jgi:hydrogenase nickel incorporation protein HypA/HybF